MGVKEWAANDEAKRMLIIRSLKDGPKGWKDLWGLVREEVGSETTLSLYLKALVREGHVTRVERREGGRHVWYTLARTRYVDELLGRQRGKKIVHATIYLSLLNEEQYVQAIITTVKRQSQLILRDYTLIGECLRKGGVVDESLRRALQAHVANLTGFIHKGCTYMVKRIQEGSLDLEKVRNSEAALLSETLKECMEMDRMHEGQCKPEGPRLVVGEILVAPRGRVKAEDLGLHRLEGVSLLPQKQDMVAVAELLGES